LINLTTNAADAALRPGAGGGGGVRVHWRAAAGTQAFEVVVEDDGPGLPETSNLFVPFFTTKPTGSGIGLVLSRQIAEAHGGRLTIANRTDGGHGCVARLQLPSSRKEP
jgi:signal transduction histidine kinase